MGVRVSEDVDMWLTFFIALDSSDYRRAGPRLGASSSCPPGQAPHAAQTGTTAGCRGAQPNYQLQNRGFWTTTTPVPTDCLVVSSCIQLESLDRLQHRWGPRGTARLRHIIWLVGIDATDTASPSILLLQIRPLLLLKPKAFCCYFQAMMSLAEISRTHGEQYRRRLQSPGYKNIRVERDALPAATFRDRILETISQNQVTLIRGETGCGKTTQVRRGWAVIAFILREIASWVVRTVGDWGPTIWNAFHRGSNRVPSRGLAVVLIMMVGWG